MMRLTYGKIFVHLTFLCGIFFCIGCSQNADNTLILASLNKPNPSLPDAKENSAETFAVEKQSSDCNKPENDDERLLCDAIVKNFDIEDVVMLEELMFISSRVDLNGDGRQEVVVWIPARSWGGTSGYPIIIFSQKEKGYRKLWDIEQAWTPVIMLKSKKNGWHNIAFQYGGGGVDWHDVVIKHNGRKYEISKDEEESLDGEIIIDKNWKSSTFGPMPAQK